MSMIFKLKFELVSYDVAYALALAAEVREGSTQEIADWIGSRTKTDCKQIAQERVQRNGESDYWPEVEEREMMLRARAHVDHLWPEGV